jgi:protein O-GlcNAc transferase
MPQVSVKEAFEAGLQYHRAGRLAEAEHIYRQILQHEPNDPDCHYLLGSIAHDRRLYVEAVASIRRAVELNAAVPEYHLRLARALGALGERAAAIAAYRAALQLRPDDAPTHVDLGNALRDGGDLDEAVEVYREALRIEPSLASAFHHVGIALGLQGQVEKAIECYRHALAIEPSASTQSYLIQTLHYHPRYTPAVIAEECRVWDETYAQPLAKLIQPLANAPKAGRKLRVGYVSTDFFDHACSHYLLPLLAGHDPEQFEIFCYAEVARPDQITQRFRGYAKVWHDVDGLTDDQLATLIRADQIDILVDLKVHTNGNRLLTFARKPAPVQVSWLGYPGATGLHTMDCRLTDPHLEAEQPGVIALPETFWCYEPRGDEPEVKARPAAQGPITFGSLHSLCKVHPALIELWAKVLLAVPDSRLLLLAGEGKNAERLLELFQRNGVTPDRIDLRSRRPRNAYLELYHGIDIVLDAFPYNGETTTFDAIWMGVPVVTLTGPTAVARGGKSILTNLGHSEWIAQTPEDYVQLVASLAGDRVHLAGLRSTLREEMSSSVLTDGPRFVRHMEKAYRGMWEQWCDAARATV